MEKWKLEQYVNTRSEIDYIARKIASLEKKIARECEDELVADIVTKGKHGKKALGVVKIEGLPASRELHDKKVQLRVLQLKYETKEVELLEIANDVEEYIQNISDSQTRQIFRFRYEDCMSWEQVASKVGGDNTADSVRKRVERTLKNDN